VTSQTANNSQTAETSNSESTNKKKKKKNKKVSEQNGETSANGPEATKPEATASPGKFVKAAENTEKMPSKSPNTQTKATNQKTNKRKFNEDDKKGPNNHKKMKFNKNGGKKFNNNQAASNELSENRLKAFGINPKKFKNKIKYNKNDGGKNAQNGHQQNHSKKPFHNKRTTS
jgi:protein KRI1